MPIYEFCCDNQLCRYEFENIQRSQDPNPQCPICATSATKHISTCGWLLEGDGWYNSSMPMKRARGGVDKKK
jgi:putative FmdB family regulatory protein